ncbi:MAG: Gfo/Idh/MocA family oxidoreductase [bacterium]
MTIKVGIIGTGNIGTHHISTFSAMQDVKVAAIFDTNQERAESGARLAGDARNAKSVEELINNSDAVVVATPDGLHSPMSLQVLAAGKHLLCEKPLTCSIDEARAVANAASSASKNGIIHMVNFTYRRSAGMQEAMRLVKSGALGQIRQVQSSYLQSWLSGRTSWDNKDWTAFYLIWKLSRSAGSRGVLGDLGCHLLDMTTICSEDLTAVRCELRTFPKILENEGIFTEYNGKALDANDTAFIELQFVNGGIGIAHTSRWATGYSNSLRLEVHGTEGAIRLDLDQSYDAIELCLGESRHRQQWDRKYMPATPTNQERFITSIRTGEQDQPDLLRGAKIQACLEACFTSAESHNWETIPVVN